jgi:hypothetical protein
MQRCAPHAHSRDRLQHAGPRPANDAAGAAGGRRDGEDDVTSAQRRSAYACSLWIRRLRAGVGLAPAVAVTLILSGCIRPIDASAHTELAAIQKQFDTVIAEIHARPDEHWHAAWHGNIAVSVGRNQHFGLCWHWQEAVYAGMRPFVEAMGWQIHGVALNLGLATEHHAVVVFNPSRITLDELFTKPEPRPAWVLDGWQRGRSDIYAFDDWARSGSLFTQTVCLEPLHP